jgi:glycine betaine/proline transport system ATP-binding protein
MQQRVGLARAFATDADILLMDEPFSALDPLIRNKLQDELRSLQQRVKKTILFVTHDLDEALKLGDQVSVLEGGRIVQTGTPADIVLRPADAYVAEFVQHMNPLSVLTGRMVMRRWADLPQDAGQRWLDDTRVHAATLNGDGRPDGVLCDGRTLSLRDARENLDDGVIAVANADTPLRQLIVWLRATGRPVLLEDAGAVCGVCGSQEVIRALAGSAGREPRV